MMNNMQQQKQDWRRTFKLGDKAYMLPVAHSETSVSYRALSAVFATELTWYTKDEKYVEYTINFVSSMLPNVSKTFRKECDELAYWISVFQSFTRLAKKRNRLVKWAEAMQEKAKYPKTSRSEKALGISGSYRAGIEQAMSKELETILQALQPKKLSKKIKDSDVQKMDLIIIMMQIAFQLVDNNKLFVRFNKKNYK